MTTKQFAKIAANVKAAVAKGERPDTVIAREIAALLVREGFQPAWVGLGTVLCVELADQPEAERCAAWFRKAGYSLEILPAVPADEMGPTLSIAFGA